MIAVKKPVMLKDLRQHDGVGDANGSSTELPTSALYGEAKRTLHIDIVVFDNFHRSLRTYEVKRGNGEHDVGKVRSILRDLICTHVLLKSYGQGRGHEVRGKTDAGDAQLLVGATRGARKAPGQAPRSEQNANLRVRGRRAGRRG